MKKRLLQTLLTCIVLGDLANAQPCKEVVGYYPNWQWYDRNKLVNPISIDYSKYTVINYCFFQPMPNGTIVEGDTWADENLLKGQIDWANNSYIPNTSIIDRAHNANVKVLLSIGGWTWSNNFPSIAADPQKRATFAHECNRLVSFYNFDGIDIDWEYPGYAPHGGGPNDAANFTLLLQQIRDSLNALEVLAAEQYLLTAAVGASQAHMNNVQWNNVVPLLDMINMMSYDFFGAWDAVANHNNPLYAGACGDPNFNIAGAFTLLTQTYSVPANKINIGVAFYGRTQSGFTTLCGPTSGTAANTAFPPDGTPLYYEILPTMNNYTQQWDAAAQVPWLSGNGVFVSYDDEHSIALKANYINTVGARGAIIWEITGDYLETTAGSGVISGTPLADTLNAVLCSNSPLATNSPDVLPSLTCFPNPANQTLTITSSGLTSNNFSTLSITDVLGRTVQAPIISRNDNQIIVDVISLPDGVYHITISDSKNMKTVKFIVAR